MNDILVLLGYCGIYAVWVLVPLLPAVLIYRMFPQAGTETRWKILGIDLKAGGASAFYFTILGLAFYKFIDPAIDLVKDLKQPYWVIDAPVKFVDVDRKEIVPRSSQEHLRVQPFSYDFKKIDERRYLVTLRFSQPKGDVPPHIRLIFPEGEGYLQLKKLMTEKNTSRIWKTIDLTGEDPIVISPVVVGGQNPATDAGFSHRLNRELESNAK